MRELFADIATGLGSGNAAGISLGLFSLTVVLYFFAMVAYCALIATDKKIIWRVGFSTAAAGCLVETIALGLRWYAAGWDHPPFTNMYESLVFFAWGIVLTYLILEIRYNIKQAGAFVIPLAFATMGLASLNPDKAISPLVPALQSIWLHLHVITASIGYAAFLVAFGLSLLFLIRDKMPINKIFAACSVLNVAGFLALTKGRALFGGFPVTAVETVNGVVEKQYVPGSNPPELLTMNVPVMGILILLSMIAFVVAALVTASAQNSDNPKSGDKPKWAFLGATGFFTLAFVYFIFESITNPMVSIKGNPYSFALLACLWFFSAIFAMINRHYDRFTNLLPTAKKLDELAYRAIKIAFPIMTLIIVTGAIWANQAWGRYWGWDPKETASLITWGIYLIYLHTRITRGWTGRRTAYISIIGFVSVVFTYLGVNLLLAGLHTYAIG